MKTNFFPQRSGNVDRFFSLSNYEIIFTEHLTRIIHILAEVKNSVNICVAQGSDWVFLSHLQRVCSLVELAHDK